jgi:hypothetical protein
LFKEQKKSTMQANEMHEKTLLEKNQGLEEQIQLAGAREKEIAEQRDAKVKQDVKMIKW